MIKNLPFKPLKKMRLYEEVAEQIKQAIFTGQLEPGDRLPSERDLSKIFNTGRPTIREALRTLSLMGLIEVNTGAKGSIVRECNINEYIETIRSQLLWLIKLDKKTIEEAWLVRKYLELGIAHAVARNATKNDIKKLDAIIKKMEACVDDIQAYFPMAVEFHKELALLTKNKIFYLIWEIFHDILLEGYIPILREMFPKGASKLLEANKVLLSAIKSKDPITINEAMEIHAKAENVYSSNSHKVEAN
jgi:GntR family transcriptional repressor for pyruvate dehydrogenase complex